MLFTDGVIANSHSNACVHMQLESTGASAAFRFVAEAPTTTVQRLRCLITGAPPSFFDIGNTFSPGALDDDTLVDVAVAAGKRVVSGRAPE